MARPTEHNKAIALRLKGMSYTEIKDKLGISKSTLHYWLKDYPLSDERIRSLRDWNAQRIERFRATMQKKRDTRMDDVYAQAQKRVGPLSKREFLLAGLFLYWAEGSKTSPSTTALTNTDPAMLLFFIRWLERCFRIPKKRMIVKLHLYSDMDIPKQTNFWLRTLDLKTSALRRVYVKKSDSNKRLNYKGRFGQGTCSILVYDRDLYEFIISGVSALRSRFYEEGVARHIVWSTVKSRA